MDKRYGDNTRERPGVSGWGLEGACYEPQGEISYTRTGRWERKKYSGTTTEGQEYCQAQMDKQSKL